MRDTAESTLSFCSVLERDEALVDSWTGATNAPKIQASVDEDMPELMEDDHDEYEQDYTYEQDYPYSTWRPPEYDAVHRPESKWKPYHVVAHQDEFETVDQICARGKFVMTPPYRGGTHEEDKLPRIYSKLDPCVLSIASESKSAHVPLHPQHGQLVALTRA